MDIKPLITASEIESKLAELGKQITEDYAGEQVLLVGVLRGAALIAASDVAAAALWQEVDVLLLDNMLVAHGRAPYTGARAILVGMAEPYSVDKR